MDINKLSQLMLKHGLVLHASNGSFHVTLEGAVRNWKRKGNMVFVFETIEEAITHTVEAIEDGRL